MCFYSLGIHWIKNCPKEMPSYPSLGHGSAVIHKDTVYLVAGQFGKLASS